MWLVAAALAALAPPCDCSPTHPAERVMEADLIFIAQVFRSGSGTVDYTIVRRHKGKAPPRLRVHDLSDACKAPAPQRGREYLVFARRSAGLWVTGPCGGAVPVDEAREYVAYLSTPNTRRGPANLVTGQLLFPPKVQTSALVRLRRGASIQYATANAAGLFAFEDVSPGEYSIEAVARGFRAVKTPVVRVAAKGVTRAWIPMEPERSRQR